MCCFQDAPLHPPPPNFTSTCVDARYLYMVLEYVVGGEFFTHLRNAQRLDNNNAKVGHSCAHSARTRTHTVKVSYTRALCMHTHVHVPSQLLVVTPVPEAGFCCPTNSIIQFRSRLTGVEPASRLVSWKCADASRRPARRYQLQQCGHNQRLAPPWTKI